MLILFAYGGSKLLTGNKINSSIKSSWDGFLLKDPNALFDLPANLSYKVIMSSGD